MPVYEYYCERHGESFERFAKIAERNDSVPCPTCGDPATRIVSSPNLNVMRAGNRKAWERNEKSAHEPRTHRKHVCGHGCNHHHHHTKSDDKKTGYKMQVNQRPWMLGH